MGQLASRHDQYMRLALDEAEAAGRNGEVPVGAVAVAGGEVIARGRNRQEEWGDPTAHAEIIALRAAAKALGDWRLNGVTLYVTLEPCPMCAGALALARVSRLVYGAADARLGAVDSVLHVLEHPCHGHRLEVIPGVLDAECRALLQQFFQRLRGEGRG